MYLPTSAPCLLFIFVACACLVHASDKEYVTDADTKAAKMTMEEMDLYCKGAEVAAEGFAGLNLEYRKGDLQNALGGENVVTEVAKRAKNAEELQTVFSDKYGEVWLAKRAMALVMAFVVLCLAFLFCCISRCTCCNKERPTSRRYKTTAAVTVAAVLLGVFVCTAVAVYGFTEAQTGGRNAECTTMQFLSTSLNGQQAHPYFVGVLPLLKDLEEADKALDVEGNHGLSAQVEEILQKTDDIKRYVDLSRETVKLLKSTMALNIEPKNSDGETMFHNCLLCKVLQDHAQKALHALDNSVANKLALAREDINKKSTPEYKAKIRKDFEHLRERVVEYKKSIRDGVVEMLGEGSAFRRAKELETVIQNVLMAVVTLGCLFAAILGCCAGISVYRFTFHEIDPVKEAKGNENPYNTKIYWYAGSTWCYGFTYIVVVLTLAGLIFSTTAVGSGVCLLATDLDANLLNQMGPALGINESSSQKDKDDFTVLKDVTEQCIKSPRNPKPSEVAYLLDITYTRDANGQKVSVRKKLEENEDTTKAIFEHITDTLDAHYVPLANLPDIQKLLNAVKLYTVREMLVGNVDKISADASRGLGDAKLEPSIKKVLGSSLACGDKTIGQDMGESSLKTTIGMEACSSALKHMSSSILPATHGCIKKVTCFPELKYYRKAACESANKYLQVKEDMFNLNTFQCDLFENPNSPSSYCDPLNMQCTPAFGRRLNTAPPALGRHVNQECTGDVCLDERGKAKTKSRPCTLVEFNKYVSDYHGRLDKLIKLIDNAVAADRPSIESTINFILSNKGASRAQSIANSVTCNFIAGYYQDLIDGACYQGVWGARLIAKSYVWTAIVTGFLVITMFAVWCRAKSNHKCWTQDRTSYMEMKKNMENPKVKDLEEGERLLGNIEVPPKTK